MRARRSARSPRPLPDRWSRVLTAAVGIAAVLLVIAVLAAGRGGVREPGRLVWAAPPPTAPCDATVLRRDTLRDELGRPFHLVPDVFQWRDGQLLVAGHLSVRIDTDAQGVPVDGEQNGVLVAVRDGDGRTRTFPRPVGIEADVRLEHVRAAELPNRRWAVLLVERAAGLGPPAAAPRAWIAILGLEGWERTHDVALPAGVRLLGAPGDPLYAVGEALLAAIPAKVDDGEFGALLVEGTASAPRLRLVPLPSASYAAAAPATRSGRSIEPALFAVHHDPSAPRSGNTLFLHHVAHAHTAPRRLSDGVTTALHRPSVYRFATGFGVVASLQSRLDRSQPPAAVFIDVPDDGPAVVHRLGEAAVKVVSTRDGEDRLLAAYSTIGPTGTAEVVLHELPAPGRGFRVPTHRPHAEILAVARAGTSDVVIAYLDGDVRRASAVSLALTRVALRCEASPREERGR